MSDKMEPKKKTNKRFVVITTALILMGGTYGVYKFVHSLAHEDTDDAQVEAHMSPVIPHVGGYVSKVNVKDNQIVKKDEKLKNDLSSFFNENIELNFEDNIYPKKDFKITDFQLETVDNFIKSNPELDFSFILN